MTQTHRTPTGGRIDRTHTIDFDFEGRTVTGHPGDTLASALLANGIHEITTSITFGRPRGIAAAWAEDPNGLLQITAPFPDPMQLATTVELAPGIAAHGVPGQGVLPTEPDPARYDTAHLHVDVLVVGAGPAGLVAATHAARAGARVALVDEHPEVGGSLHAVPRTIEGVDGVRWAAYTADELEAAGGVVLRRTTVFGLYDDGLALAVERRSDHLGDTAPADALRQRVWRIRAGRTIVATGAHERPVVFADNDRPGILLATSARAFLHRFGVRVGDRAVVFTTNDSAYGAAFDLADAGVEILAVVDSRGGGLGGPAREAARRGIPVLTGHVVVGTDADEGGRVRQVFAAPFDGATIGATRSFDADTLLVSGGWNPAAHLYSQAGGRLRFDERLGAFVPDGPAEGVSVAGSAAGRFDSADVVDDARRAADVAVADLGLVPADGPHVDLAADDDHEPGDVLWFVPTGDPVTLSTHFVDAQRDATVADIATAIGAGLRSIEHIKRYTTIGTAHDQGKTSGVVAAGVTAVLTGTPIGAVGTTTHRPPYTPVPFAALAGRSRGALYDPVRITAVHDWHVAHGAEFEDVGQWKRPWYYPQPGEDIHAAVARETVAARGAVGILDGSTLGKIDVQGPDAPEFLDRIYTNLMSSLKIGSVRYGVMCGVDGMVIDDGTVLRLAEDRYLVYTTTGGAAHILDWLEEWLQTEWPELRVHLTSLTEHEVTFPVVGPRSRAVVGELFPEVDVSNEAFPFMTWRETTLGGVPVRLARVSFSGELAYEVSTVSWYGLDLWERLITTGEPYGITPYGTETMHVLRAEKGYPIVGQDTDGTVTPQDLGMNWVVSKKKLDFVGKRSFARTANQDPNRRQFVGLLPDDPTVFIPEGSQLVTVTDLDRPGRVPMHGFVTSSYDSRALGSTFALALVDGGHGRIGEKINAVVDGLPVPATITSHVLFDPEGARRDG
ncbi:FAD-dependent oxidoreductase [Pseudoclavibacter chungangensis]|uniref:Sarcosine oxidase subunit alpha n=1 Tax=Pseudoclavibacter chungangensis TaxID=587635 RepID=A0A7J5C1P0_9MICO|nr:2Fe-2S iron-sulfur cluster-binding protein [Pseudoclavibacter chungangensis]KAB1660345.1 FAD-dependent oxidoreductase [Pseudoclavibacter chungangensis]NYJ65704.1 sarcosine oxidase subunit alpha [Pseudoclavibacter chungangensis]